MKFFDYFFYRIYSFYKNKGSDIPIGMGTLALSLIMSLSLASLNTILSVLFSIKIYINKIGMGLLMLVFILLVVKQYGNEQKAEILEKKYSKETNSQKQANGIIIIVYIILVFVIPISVSYMRHNLGWNI
jgi:Ca2+/Na+ antiporter